LVISYDIIHNKSPSDPVVLETSEDPPKLGDTFTGSELLKEACHTFHFQQDCDAATLK